MNVTILCSHGWGVIARGGNGLLVAAGGLILVASVVSVCRKESRESNEPESIQSELVVHRATNESSQNAGYGAVRHDTSLSEVFSEDPLLALHSSSEVVIDKAQMGFLGSQVTGLNWVRWCLSSDCLMHLCTVWRQSGICDRRLLLCVYG